MKCGKQVSRCFGGSLCILTIYLIIEYSLSLQEDLYIVFFDLTFLNLLLSLSNLLLVAACGENKNCKRLLGYVSPIGAMVAFTGFCTFLILDLNRADEVFVGDDLDVVYRYDGFLYQALHTTPLLLQIFCISRVDAVKHKSQLGFLAILYTFYFLWIMYFIPDTWSISWRFLRIFSRSSQATFLFILLLQMCILSEVYMSLNRIMRDRRQRLHSAHLQ
jgi:hypothetical protein